MSLLLSTYQYASPRDAGGALRIGVTRYLPRGIAKADYARLGYFDLWFPLLAPSRELLAWYRDTDPPVSDFYRRYKREMGQTDARQAVLLLAEMAKRTPVAIGCYCEDESRCHRTALAQLIRAADN